MEVKSNGAPSLPANYLTLAQLRDRWLKEQERKQIEKLNQEREFQQQQEREEMAEREGKQREEDDAKNRTQNQNGATKELMAAAKTTHVRDRRNQHRRKAHEPRIEADVVDDVARVAEESRQQQQQKKKTTKKNSSWKKRNESRAAKMEAGEMAEVQPEAKEEVEKVVVEKTRELERAKSKIQRNRNDSNRKGKQWVEKEKVLGDEKAHLILLNFEGLSVNGDKEGNMRSREGRNGGYRRGSGRVDDHSKRPQGRRDGNYVWIKKGDSTDAGVNGVRC